MARLKAAVAALGKAAWQMAKAAWDCLGGEVDEAFVITKYGHSRGAIGDARILEAGHPVIGENAIAAADAVRYQTG